MHLVSMLLLSAFLGIASSAWDPALGDDLSSAVWNITAPLNGVYVQYDPSKEGNDRFSGLTIDLLREVCVTQLSMNQPTT